jgi:hypothetical protein
MVIIGLAWMGAGGIFVFVVEGAGENLKYGTR